MTPEPKHAARFDKIWPTVIVASGLGLTAIWISVLGYAVVSVIMWAI